MQCCVSKCGKELRDTPVLHFCSYSGTLWKSLGNGDLPPPSLESSNFPFQSWLGPGEQKEAGKLADAMIIRLINSSPGTVEPGNKQAAGGEHGPFYDLTRWPLVCHPHSASWYISFCCLMMQLLMLLSKMKHHGDMQTHVQKKYLWLSQFKASFSTEYINLYMSLQSLFHLLRNRVQEWQHDPIKTYKMHTVN